MYVCMFVCICICCCIIARMFYLITQGHLGSTINAPEQSERIPQNAMTMMPAKVWPINIIDYSINPLLGKRDYIYTRLIIIHNTIIHK